MQNFFLLGDLNVIGVRFLVGKMEIALNTIICLFIFFIYKLCSRAWNTHRTSFITKSQKNACSALCFLYFSYCTNGENWFNSQERLLCLIVFLSFTVWRIQMFVTPGALRIQPPTGINFGVNCVNNKILESDWFSRTPLSRTTITY